MMGGITGLMGRGWDDKYLLRTKDNYTVTNGEGTDLTGYDVMGSQLYGYFYDKYGDKNYKNRGSTMVNGYSYYRDGNGELSPTTTDPMSLLQDRLPITGISDPFTNIITNYNLSDLYYGKDWRPDEINAYKQAANFLSQYITNTNSDGTVDLFIPKGVATGTHEGNPFTDTTNQDTTVKGIRLLKTDAEINTYLDQGNGYLGRYKEGMLKTQPDAFKANQYALGGFDWAGESQKELDYNKQYGQKVLEIADQQAAYDQQLAEYERKKNAGRGMYKQGGAGGGTMPIGRGLGAADSSQLTLNKYSLLG